MIFQIKLSDEAEKDILSYRKSGNKSALKKIDVFIDELRINPYSGTGKPERLKHKTVTSGQEESTAKTGSFTVSKKK